MRAELKSEVYAIKEIYYTLQGEGFHAGRPAVFCRFSGCNLWSGLEKDRATAICKFCDTDFWGTDGQNGAKYNLTDLVQKCQDIWGNPDERAFIVFTGGEPALQLDAALIAAFHAANFEIAIETNGTLALPDGIDWVCVSPKADSEIIITKGDELKLVYPQKEHTPEQYQDLDFGHFYIQPLDDHKRSHNTRQSIEFCLANPKWKLSIQTHKVLQID